MDRDKMIEKIRQIVANEKFKLDAFFLCGAASGLPDQGLQKACEVYLEMTDKNEDDEDIKNALIDQLEAALSKEPEIKVKGDITNNRAALQEVYDNREYL